MNDTGNNKNESTQQESQQYSIIERKLRDSKYNRIFEKWLKGLMIVVAIILAIVVLLAYTIG